MNKTALIERIADLVRDGRIDEITDMRDESDRHGMRIVIELRRGAQPNRVLNQLYKYTPLQSTFRRADAGAGGDETGRSAAPALAQALRCKSSSSTAAKSSAGAASSTWPRPARAPTSWKACASRSTTSTR